MLTCRVFLKKKTLFQFPFHSQLVNYQRSKKSLLPFWLIKSIPTATAWSPMHGLFLLPSLVLGRVAPQRRRTGGGGLGTTCLRSQCREKRRSRTHAQATGCQAGSGRCPEAGREPHPPQERSPPRSRPTLTYASPCNFPVVCNYPVSPHSACHVVKWLAVAMETKYCSLKVVVFFKF